MTGLEIRTFRVNDAPLDFKTNVCFDLGYKLGNDSPTSRDCALSRVMEILSYKYSVRAEHGSWVLSEMTSCCRENRGMGNGSCVSDDVAPRLLRH